MGIVRLEVSKDKKTISILVDGKTVLEMPIGEWSKLIATPVFKD